MLHANGQDSATGSDRARSAPRRVIPIKGRTRRAGMVGLIGALGVLLAACSSSAGANTASSTTTTAKSNKPSAASFEAYATCLKNHGVSFPAGRGGFPGGGGGGAGGGFPGGSGGTPPSSAPPKSGTTSTTFSAAERSKLQAAESACASLRPKFNGGVQVEPFHVSIKGIGSGTG
jgi:hypothetical protein